MLRFYEHPKFDIGGSWNNLSGDMKIWFLIAKLDTPERIAADSDERAEELMTRISQVTVGAQIELVSIPEPIVDEDHSPLERPRPSELYLEEPTEGLALIKASCFQSYGSTALEDCVNATAEVYPELVFEKAGA